MKDYESKAPHWVHAFADSLIKIAAAVSIVISSLTIHFKTDPVEQAIQHTSKMMITLKGLLNDQVVSERCDLSTLNKRFEDLEAMSHNPKKNK